MPTPRGAGREKGGGEEVKADGRHEHHTTARFTVRANTTHRRGLVYREAHYGRREGLSVQMDHHRRALGSGGGTARVTINGEVKLLGENVSPSYIPLGRPTARKNPGKNTARFN